MKKKIISLFTALVMVVGLIGVMPIAGVSAETSGDYEYEILEDGTVEITGYTGDAAELEIPDTIDGMTVTSIGNSAFKENEDLIRVTMPDSIKSIGFKAYMYCRNLETVNIPSGVEYIGTSAFGATAITSIYIPNSIKFIAPNTFWYCTNLKNLTIPNSVTDIGEWAFAYCDSLTCVIIPKNVTSIGDEAFGYGSGVARGGNIFKNSNFKIYCYAGTAGEQYAIDNGFDYELLDEEPVPLEQIDINGDGKISTADVGLINAHAKGTKLLSGESLGKADVNGDGTISTADVGLINAYAKGTKKYA